MSERTFWGYEAIRVGCSVEMYDINGLRGMGIAIIPGRRTFWGTYPSDGARTTVWSSSQRAWSSWAITSRTSGLTPSDSAWI
jgi:hypothetical protein